MAWDELLKDSPIKVNRNSVIIGDKKYTNDDLACLFIRPIKDNNKNMIGVVSGTGLVGLKLNNVLPFMSPGFTYPDVTVFSSDLLLEDEKGYKLLVSLVLSGRWEMVNLFLNKMEYNYYEKF